MPATNQQPPATVKARKAKTPGKSPGRPSRAQSEARHRELLDRALDLFLERGFEGTTIDAIIDAVGMSRRTVYARYEDKIALFRAALQRAVDDWVVPAERLREAECDDLEETLIGVARLLVANVRSPSGLRLTRIANAEVFRMPDIADYLWQSTAQVTLAYLEDLFDRRLRSAGAGPARSQDAALAFLILIVEGSFQMTAWGRLSDAEMDRQVLYRVRLFLNGASAAQ